MPRQYENIPSLLKHWPHWVVWGVDGANLKAPFDPSSLLCGRPQAAKAGVRETWGSYADAVTCVERGLAKGIGYEFNGGGIYGVDLDHVIGEGGVLSPEAREVVNALNSYTEISPSGNGLHIFVIGKGADITRHRKKDYFLEIYGEARYFTVTGDVYGGARGIEKRVAELQGIHDKFFVAGEVERHGGVMPNGAQRGTSTSFAVISGASMLNLNGGADVSEFLEKGLARDRVFKALWNGERSHRNESADDQSLMNKLAYWCNADPSAMVRAFMESPYYAQKDAAHKKKCLRADYLPVTAAKACSTVYSTAKADSDKWHERRRAGGAAQTERAARVADR